MKTTRVDHINKSYHYLQGGVVSDPDARNFKDDEAYDWMENLAKGEARGEILEDVPRGNPWPGIKPLTGSDIKDIVRQSGGVHRSRGRGK